MQEIRFFNSMGRTLERFEPHQEGKVSIYTCGPTVYNHAHIGNLRTFVFEDLLRRSLRFLGYEVYQVMNLTDVDDKTIQRASDEGKSLEEYTATYIDSFFADLDTLKVERAELYPRATRHIDEMIELIQTLIDRGHAYPGDDGSVFFRISSDEDYGRLSCINLDNVRRGERVASDEYSKEDVRDFVLWKAAKEGEPSWESPWGQGRPGWHIECSAMSMKYLGESFDIHCGGVDNMFPHHENEIAQSECATGQEFVRTWLHAEHLIVDGQKMSKSLGNQFTLKELVERGASARALRYLFISTHYRQKLNFTFDGLKAVNGALRRLDEMRFRLDNATESGSESETLTSAIQKFRDAFAQSLAQDLNISAALSKLFDFVKEVNKVIEEGLGDGDRQRVLDALSVADQVLAILDPAEWVSDNGQLAAADEGLSDEEIDQLLEARQTARKQRDFAEADRIRDELKAMSIVIEDTPQGARWRRG